MGPSTDFKLKVEGPYITATQYEGILAGDVIILTIHVPKGAEFVALNINNSSRYTELGEGNTHEFAVYEDLIVSVEFNFGSVVHASNEAELNYLLENEAIKEIVLENNMELTKPLLVTRTVTINGNSKTLTLLTRSRATWSGAYVINVYDTKGVEIKNITLSGGNAGLLVNGSTVTVIDVTLNNHSHGGIEVSRGKVVSNDPKLVVNGEIQAELGELPVIWIDGKTTNDGWVGVTTGLTELVRTDKNQVWYLSAPLTEMTVSTEAELIIALSLSFIETIKIKGTIGSADAYNVYTVNRAVTILGQSDSKVFGTFIIKSNGVEINGLAIENKGDLAGESTANRGAIYVYAENVILKNNTITTGLTGEGLANGIQIMSTTADTNIENYKIEGNTITGLSSETGTWSSSGIVFSQGFNSPTVGGEGQTIIGNQEYYKAILAENTFNNNKIDLTHQDWTKESDKVVLFPLNNA